MTARLSTPSAAAGRRPAHPAAAPACSAAAPDRGDTRARPRTSCPCGLGCPRCQVALLQCTARISTPGDRFEREADQVADQVMRMAQPSAIGSAGDMLQRSCPACDDEERPSLQRDPSSDAVATLNPAAALRAAASGGAPLSGDLRADFEPRFGHDFSAVRLHHDGDAAHGARAVQARAYTIGRDIVFGAGEFAPSTAAGKRLLAHELTHVIQQGGGSAPTREGLSVLRASASGVIMRETCEEKCERNFDQSSGDATKRLGERNYCLHQCRPPEPEPEPPPPAPAPAPRQETPAKCKAGDVPEPCPAPTGPGNHPVEVSKTLKDRWMGKFAKIDLDPGEGCLERPYVAGAGETVCTIGYGHQLPDCPVLSKTTGQPPTQEERFPPKPKTPEEKKAFRPPILNMKCACADTVRFDCKGPQAERKLKGDAAAGARHVHDVVPVDLDQAQFDALVDIALHVGHVPDGLVAAIKKYWCTDAGKDHVRQLYLKTALTPQGSKTQSKGFIARRKFRVWPPVCEP